SIFQQEKEWLKAADYAVKLEAIDRRKQPILLSHLYCQLALLSNAELDRVAARNYLKKALRIDSSCVRANVISAEIAMAESDYKEALKAILKIQDQDERFVPVFIDVIINCFNQLDMSKKKFDFLAGVQANNQSTIAMSRFVDVLIEQKSNKEALAFLHEKLLQNPQKGYLKLYAEFDVDNTGESESVFLRGVIKQLAEEEQSFKCRQCGFSSVDLNWCCPSCKDWGTVEPILT
ncbi:MAG: lipopolysaccharide assembly protein LapB, partial [Cycloclasticus sp.]